jgi:hypothetical protein
MDETARSSPTPSPSMLRSMTWILEVLDPSNLPRRIQTTLQEIGPFLADGLTYKEIGELTGHSEDWVASRVTQIRDAILAEGRKYFAQLPEGQRARVEALRRSSTA